MQLRSTIKSSIPRMINPPNGGYVFPLLFRRRGVGRGGRFLTSSFLFLLIFRHAQKALLLTLAILWSHWCQSEPGGGVMLAIAPTNADAIISWPYPSRGFGLEFATNLVGMTNWQPAWSSQRAWKGSLQGPWAKHAPWQPADKSFTLNYRFYSILRFAILPRPPARNNFIFALPPFCGV